MSGAPRRVLMVGAGGHARVCLEALQEDPLLQVVGCVSRDGTAIEGLRVDIVGADADLAAAAARVGASHVFVAIGHNATRAAVIERCRAAGLHLVNAISRFAMVSSSARIGAGVALLPGAVVNAAAQLDDGVIVNTNASVDHDCRVGEAAHIGPGAALAGEVVVGRGALVGIGSRVLPGASIGSFAVVGAGAVVLADVDDGVTVVGVPARPLQAAGS